MPKMNTAMPKRKKAKYVVKYAVTFVLTDLQEPARSLKAIKEFIKYDLLYPESTVQIDALTVDSFDGS